MAYDGTGLPPDAIRVALARTIGRWTQGTEDRSTLIPDLAFFRREAPTPPGICQVKPSVIVVVQGAKRMLVGDDAYAYDSERFLIASLDVPASSEVVEASRDRPCLGLVLKLDLRMMTELVAQTRLPPPKDRSVARGMALGAATPTLLESFKRLTDLLDEPDAIEVLAPLMLREIHYRLLTSICSMRSSRTASRPLRACLSTRRASPSKTSPPSSPATSPPRHEARSRRPRQSHCEARRSIRGGHHERRYDRIRQSQSRARHRPRIPPARHREDPRHLRRAHRRAPRKARRAPHAHPQAERSHQRPHPRPSRRPRRRPQDRRGRPARRDNHSRRERGGHRQIGAEIPRFRPPARVHPPPPAPRFMKLGHARCPSAAPLREHRSCTTPRGLALRASSVMYDGVRPLASGKLGHASRPEAPRLGQGPPRSAARPRPAWLSSRRCHGRGPQRRSADLLDGIIVHAAGFALRRRQISKPSMPSISTSSRRSSSAMRTTGARCIDGGSPCEVVLYSGFVHISI